MNAQTAALVGVVAFACSFAGTWVVRKAMIAAGIMDVPAGERKSHRKPVAYEGGIAMYVAFLVGLVTAAWLVPSFIFEMSQLYGVLLGATLAILLGVADDMMDLRPIIKLVGQLGIGIAMYRLGFRIDRISNPFGGDFPVPPGISIAGTVLWYALLMNAVNMVDGLDGLAAGIVGISALTLFAVAVDLNQPLGALLALIVFAACAGFLPFNFSPATIFMGDAGSLFLGFMLATITLLSSSKAPALLALLIPVLAVGVPIFDTLFAFIRRTLRGQHPFRGDRRHLHHRFLLLGFTERRTVLIFYYITAYFGVMAYVLQRMEARSILPLVLIVVIGLLIIVENMRFLEKRSENGSQPLAVPNQNEPSNGDDD